MPLKRPRVLSRLVLRRYHFPRVRSLFQSAFVQRHVIRCIPQQLFVKIKAAGILPIVQSMPQFVVILVAVQLLNTIVLNFPNLQQLLQLPASREGRHLLLHCDQTSLVERFPAQLVDMLLEEVGLEVPVTSLILLLLQHRL